jgi:NADP-dependent 3-hydroxy acid dehydrogenase YdfG
MTSVKDHVAVITGASSGIGKQIALCLAAAGMRTCLLGRNLTALETVAAEAEKTSPQTKCYKIDLSVESDILQVCDHVQHDFGFVDILVHSAGIISFGSLASAPIADFDRQYQVNVRAPVILTQALLPMLRSRKGQIVFINSSAGLSASPNTGHYAATKFALKAIADSFRQEVNAEGLRVLSVYPGRTASPMQAAIFKMEGKAYRPELLIQPADVAALILTAIALPRSAEVTDINVRPLTKPS